MKRALITGVTGQDGSYLAEYLLGKGYEVWGLVRRSSNDPLVRLRDIAKHPKMHISYGNLRDEGSLRRVLEAAKPDEVYNLAAQSDVRTSFDIPEETSEINFHGVVRLMHAIEETGLSPRVYQASTSEMFGESPPPQNEETPFRPVSPYARTKVRAHEECIVPFRKKGMYACSGILFNHESPRRGEHFVTRKITISFAKMALGLQEHLELGNMNAKRDWGHAREYVEAMHAMLQLDRPEDFVIATGQTHTVREFVDEVASVHGMTLQWEGEGIDEVARNSVTGKLMVKVNPKFYRPQEVNHLLGNAEKAKLLLGWKPRIEFRALVREMAYADLSKVSIENDVPVELEYATKQ